jgi:hypothetical protein
MSDLSPLSGAERKLDLGAVRSPFDPKRSSAKLSFCGGEAGFNPYQRAHSTGYCSVFWTFEGWT